MKTIAREELFERMPVLKAIRVMAIPTILSQIIVLIYNLADTIFIGQTNNPYMVAGASLILPIFNICSSIAGLTGVGGGALVSRLLGEGRIEEAKKVSTYSIYLALIVSALFSILTLIFLDPLLSALGASDNTIKFAEQYAICVIVLGAVPTVLSNVLSNLLRSAGISKEAGFGIMLGGILNVFLDPLFMFVILPKGNELIGAGIATFISNVVACIFLMYVVIKKHKQQIVSFDLKIGLPEKKSIMQIFAIGIPSGLSILLFDLDYIIIDKLIAGYGDIPLAAMGIVLKAERLPLNVGIGLCQGMMPLIAYNYSKKNHKRNHDTIKYSLIIGLIVSAFSIVLYHLTSEYIVRAFINEQETVRLATDFLRIRILATPLMFGSFFTVHIFQGYGDGKRSLVLGVLRWGVFNIPMLLILNSIFGMYGVVWAQVMGDILTVTVSLIVYFSHKKELEKVELSYNPV